MITIEELNGEEVYAVDSRNCKKCMLAFDNALCARVRCTRGERPDGRCVVFRPIDDIRTTMAYAAQQGTPQ